MASIMVEFPRRQAMLEVHPNDPTRYNNTKMVPVLVWPMPTSEGMFVVEHQNGTTQMVQPDSLTFLGSKEMFDQYDWSES